MKAEEHPSPRDRHAVEDGEGIELVLGDLLAELWTTLLERYGDLFCACRTGDDMGFKSSTLLAPQALIDNVVPQYSRIVKIVHTADKPYLLHSCGCIFDIMDDIIDVKLFL